MNILGIDTTGNTLSAAVQKEEKLLSEIYVDIGIKHSATLMPAVSEALAAAALDVGDIDVFAVAAGPGSFTGIRIGVAACAGMAHAAYQKVAAVSTLEALMENAAGADGIVCAVMDARRQEVYTSACRGKDVIVEESAMPLAFLLEEKLPKGKVIFVGDAAVKYRDMICGLRQDSFFLPPQFMMQRASSVCALAYRQAREGKLLYYDELRPRYLRESQAERLRKEKIGR